MPLSEQKIQFVVVIEKIGNIFLMQGKSAIA